MVSWGLGEGSAPKIAKVDFVIRYTAILMAKTSSDFKALRLQYSSHYLGQQWYFLPPQY